MSPRWPIAGTTPNRRLGRHLLICDLLRDAEDILNMLGSSLPTAGLKTGLPTMLGEVTEMARNCSHRGRLSSLTPAPTRSGCSDDTPRPRAHPRAGCWWSLPEAAPDSLLHISSTTANSSGFSTGRKGRDERDLSIYQPSRAGVRLARRLRQLAEILATAVARCTQNRRVGEE
jgi:hypothetical protein